MGILDGIVEWIAEQVMAGLDLVTTSVLGALGCDMAVFLRYVLCFRGSGNRDHPAQLGLAVIQKLRSWRRCGSRRPGKAEYPFRYFYPADALFR